MALLVVVIGAGLAALLLPMVIMQNTVTRFDQRRATSLHAAETGIDVALGIFRHAGTVNDDGIFVGNTKALPCGPLSGPAGSDGKSSYSVAISYFTKNPSAQTDAWRSANKMACAPEHGVHIYDTPSKSDIYIPSFILITSTGKDSPTDQVRTLQATYVVKTTNANIAGGLLRFFPDTNDANFCFDAGASPKVGTKVLVQPCAASSAEALPQQKWAYLNNLTLQLTATVGDASLNSFKSGLCIQSKGKGNAVVLANCPDFKKSGSNYTHDSNGNLEPGSASYDLIWGMNDSGHLEASNSTKNGLSGNCLNAPQTNIGSPTSPKYRTTSGGQITVASCTTGTTDSAQALNLAPEVGAGQAGAASSQIVNFQMFGRCIDVTNQRTSGSDSGGQFLILYPCKQNPDTGALAWNQKFTSVKVSGGVQWRTYPSGGGTFCLTSPGVVNGYVIITSCSTGTSTGAQAQVWTYREANDSDGNPLPFALKYTMVDYKGLCLSRGPSDDDYNKNLKVIVAACDGTTAQKWNADPNLQNPTLTDLHETAG